MGERQAHSAIARILDEIDDREVAGGASEERIAQVERKLGVELPRSYRAFLEQFGAGDFGHFIVFGIVDDADGPLADLDAVERTLTAREESNLPTTAVIFSERGDTANLAFQCAERDQFGECPVAIFPREYSAVEEPNMLAEDFGDWLLRTVDER
jgi:hypothetical protein